VTWARRRAWFSRQDANVADFAGVADIAEALRAADVCVAPSHESLVVLNARIVSAAAPLLDERAAPYRTVWDYTERWAATLLPIGALTAIAAGLFLFALADHRQPAQQRMPGVRIALLGAATNRMSSQSLVDFLVDDARPVAARSTR
jgi:hypothetical protein